MKPTNFLFWFIFSSLLSSKLQAQDCSCEKFPYQFCGQDGRYEYWCTDNPYVNGPTSILSPMVPVKDAQIFGCITNGDIYDCGLINTPGGVEFGVVSQASNVQYAADVVSAGDLFTSPNPYYLTNRNFATYDWQGTILDCALDTMTFDTTCCFEVVFESDLDWWQSQLVDGKPIDMSNGGPLGLSQYDLSSSCTVPCENHKIFINTTERFFTNQDDPNYMPDHLIRCYANFGFRLPISSGTLFTGKINGDRQNVYSDNWFDLESVIVHEMGHYLGLPDRDIQCANLSPGSQCGTYDPNSIMSHLSPGQERIREGPDDCCWIQKLYWPSKVPPCPADGVSYGQSFQINLDQSTPNPSTGAADIGFSNDQPMRITIELYDILGHTLLTLTNQQLFQPGYHTISIGPNQLSSGKYIYSLRAGGKVISKEMTVIK